MELDGQCFSFSWPELGHYTLVRLHWAPAAQQTAHQMLDEGLFLNGPPKMVVGLDVSGSMKASMKALESTMLGLLDALPSASSVKVFTFDHEVHSLIEDQILSAERTPLKAFVAAMGNRGGRTHLEAALIESLQFGNRSILLLTDGLANEGLCVTSATLTSLARSLPYYTTCNFHTLGLAKASLNAELLKNLAVDTNGTFRLGLDDESVQSFVGDLLASHYMRRVSSASVHVLTGTAAVPELLTPRPVRGFEIRADRPLDLLFRWASGVPEKLNVFANGLTPHEDPVGYGLGLHPVPDPTKAHIVWGALLGAYVASKDTKGLQALRAVLETAVSGGNSAAAPVLAALVQSASLLADGAAETRASNKAVELLYNVSSINAVDTEPVTIMRDISLQMSQQHY